MQSRRSCRPTWTILHVLLVPLTCHDGQRHLWSCLCLLVGLGGRVHEDRRQVVFRVHFAEAVCKYVQFDAPGIRRASRNAACFYSGAIHSPSAYDIDVNSISAVVQRAFQAYLISHGAQPELPRPVQSAAAAPSQPLAQPGKAGRSNMASSWRKTSPALCEARASRQRLCRLPPRPHTTAHSRAHDHAYQLRSASASTTIRTTRAPTRSACVPARARASRRPKKTKKPTAQEKPPQQQRQADDASSQRKIQIHSAMAIPPSSPRLPSPPPAAEIQIGPKSPAAAGATLAQQQMEQQMEQTILDANSKRRIHPGTRAADFAVGPPLVPLNEVGSGGCEPGEEERRQGGKEAGRPTTDVFFLFFSSYSSTRRFSSRSTWRLFTTTTPAATPYP